MTAIWLKIKLHLAKNILPQDSCYFQTCNWRSIDHPAYMQDVYTMSDQAPCYTPTVVITMGTDSTVPRLGDQQIKFLKLMLESFSPTALVVLTTALGTTAFHVRTQ